MRTVHPFADKWNHSTAHYPEIARLVAGAEVVLDVGCGEGTLARYLADEGHQVIGIDSDASVLSADEPGVHFVLADATALPYPADSFDAVVSVMVLHQTRMELALAEMRRVLKPGGVLVDLGCAADKGAAELARSGLDIPATLWARRGKTRWEPATRKVDPRLGWAETKAIFEQMLPGNQWQRVTGWRYLASWRRPE